MFCYHLPYENSSKMYTSIQFERMRLRYSDACLIQFEKFKCLYKQLILFKKSLKYYSNQDMKIIVLLGVRWLRKDIKIMLLKMESL